LQPVVLRCNPSCYVAMRCATLQRSRASRVMHLMVGASGSVPLGQAEQSIAEVVEQARARAQPNLAPERRTIQAAVPPVTPARRPPAQRSRPRRPRVCHASTRRVPGRSFQIVALVVEQPQLLPRVPETDDEAASSSAPSHACLWDARVHAVRARTDGRPVRVARGVGRSRCGSVCRARRGDGTDPMLASSWSTRCRWNSAAGSCACSMAATCRALVWPRRNVSVRVATGLQHVCVTCGGCVACCSVLQPIYMSAALGSAALWKEPGGCLVASTQQPVGQPAVEENEDGPLLELAPIPAKAPQRSCNAVRIRAVLACGWGQPT
jgi:hypothetical protein